MLFGLLRLSDALRRRVALRGRGAPSDSAEARDVADVFEDKEMISSIWSSFPIVVLMFRVEMFSMTGLSLLFGIGRSSSSSCGISWIGDDMMRICPP